MKMVLISTAAALLLNSALSFADHITRIRNRETDCTAPQVTWDGKIGAFKNYDRDSVALLRAVEANPADFLSLTKDGYVISGAKIEVLRPKKKGLSKVKQYTFEAHEFRSVLDEPDKPLKRRTLTIQEYKDLEVMDDTESIWKSSGVKDEK
jgi:hypothetical protein